MSRGSLGGLILVIVLGALLMSGAAGAAKYSASNPDVIEWVVPGAQGESRWLWADEIRKLWESVRPDVKVKMIPQAELRDMNVPLAAGRPPDIQSIDPSYYSTNPEVMKAVVPIPETYFTNEEKAGIGQEIMNRLRLPRGGYVMFPHNQWVLGGVIIANRTTLRELGYNVGKIREQGWTVDDMRTLAKKATKGDRKGLGMDLGGSWNLMWPFYMGWDASPWPFFPFERWQAPNPNTAKGLLQLTQQNIQDVFELVHDLLYVDKSWDPKYLGLTHIERRRAFFEGKLALSFDGDYGFMDQIKEYNMKVGTGVLEGSPLDAALLPYPKFPGAKDVPPIFYVYGWGVFKQRPYKGDEHTKNALDFANFMSSAPFSVWSTVPPDTRVWKGKYAMLPKFVEATDNAQYFFYDLVPKAVVALAFGEISKQAENAFNKWQTEAWGPTREAVLLNRMSPQDAAKKVYSTLAAALEAAFNKGYWRSLEQEEKDAGLR